MKDFVFTAKNADGKFKEIEILFSRLVKKVNDRVNFAVPKIKDPLNVLSYYTPDVSFDGVVFRGIFFSGQIVKLALNFKTKDAEVETCFRCTIKRKNTETSTSFETDKNTLLEKINFDTQDGDIVDISCVSDKDNISDVYCGILFKQ